MDHEGDVMAKKMPYGAPKAKPKKAAKKGKK
jgi:hypothetical protein